MKTKHLVCVSVVTGLFLALAILPQTLQAEDVIKVGVIADLDFPAGKAIRNAVEMAAEEINASGGIMGRQVELVIADTKLNHDMGAYEYTRLAGQEKVAAVLGTWASEMALEILEHVPKYKVPYLTGSAAPEIAEKIKQNYDSLKYVFRMYFNSYEMADFSSEWLIDEMVKKRGLKRFAMMVEEAKWAHPIAAKWKKELKNAGAEVAVTEYFDKNTKDYKPIFSRIIEAECEMTCVLTAFVDAAAFLPQWTESKATLMGGIIGSFPNSFRDLGDNAVSIVSLSWPGIFPVKEKDRTFLGKYSERYKLAPDYNATNVYDALYMLKSAVERAKSVEADAIVEAMEKTDYEGVMGRWVFDKTSHHSKFGPGFRNFIMMQWQENGKACIIWPEDVKTCEMILPPWYKKK